MWGKAGGRSCVCDAWGGRAWRPLSSGWAGGALGFVSSCRQGRTWVPLDVLGHGVLVAGALSLERTDVAQACFQTCT